MAIHRHFFPSLVMALSAPLMLAACGAKAEDELPAPVQMIADQGVSFVGNFDAPGGLTGYVGEYQGQGVAVYLTPDGEHAVVGNMLNSEGQDIAAEHIRRLIDEPRYGEAWGTIEEANWFIEGDENAPNIVYTFTDPFCPYCRRMHEAMKPYVDAGQIQVRHIMVGIIREASPAIAATIIGSDNPMEKLLEHMDTIDDGGIVMQGTAMRSGQRALREHHDMMRGLNLSATPVTFYKDRNGVVQQVQGAPQPQQIEQMIVN